MVPPRAFYTRDPLEVAPGLLGMVLAREDGRAGRIVEAEAYRGTADAASHAYRGQTPRNSTMFGPPGHLYVYFTYGMHFCCNVVCGPSGVAGAVLLRALAPVEPLEPMSCAGPARLCKALGIDRSLDGADLLDPASPVRLLSPEPDDDLAPGAQVVMCGPRIGLGDRVGQAASFPWRFWLDGERAVKRSGTRQGRRVHRP
ncbi:MAG TPA: DNA-3-methyladenine glycosylase [Acidimicrobiales bacterium]|nr:DNA-3-methyladenine glycosylase [Acidimicrobiales bacterium]